MAKNINANVVKSTMKNELMDDEVNDINEDDDDNSHELDGILNGDDDD